MLLLLSACEANKQYFQYLSNLSLISSTQAELKNVNKKYLRKLQCVKNSTLQHTTKLKLTA
jgi:hypothetical protein